MSGEIVNKDLVCHVCDGNQFTLNEGFYYCEECGTQLKQVLDLNLDEDYVEDLSRLQRKVIKKDTNETKVEVTSWEVMNYILRGLVEELLSLGAKEELKETVLQLWSTLLRHRQVAFFNKKQPELPKLGLRFCPTDAKVLYNRKIQKTKNKRDRKRKSSSAKRELQKQKKLLELSEYEEYSKSEASISTLSNSMSLNSSTSANSNKAVRLSFRPYARKHFKKQMGSKHLAKHELDHDLNLSCHSLRVRTNKLKWHERAQEIRNATLYTVLYVALNLIEDDIQLSDLRRYCVEGRLTMHHIDKFFPENIAKECLKVADSINYTHSMKSHMFNDWRMRQNIFQLCQSLAIPDLKIPNIKKLCQRYITDLALPKDLMKFVERLINIYKPEMKAIAQHPPNYEARAMAYIVFVLKLLFGLDDSMELEISESSRKINETISDANLFVFEDWQRYLEMRKIILAQVYMPFALSYKIESEGHSRNEYLRKEFMEDARYFRKPQVDNLNRIIESFISKFHHDEPEEFDFSLPSMTPNATYFQTVLKSSKKLVIPDFMHKNPANSSIEAFINPENLKSLAKENMYKLRVEELALRQHEHVGVFKNYKEMLFKREHTSIRVKRVEFDIELEDWEKKLNDRLDAEALVFGTKEMEKTSYQRFIKINRSEKPNKNQQAHVKVKEENLFDESPKDDDSMEFEENFQELPFKVSKMEYWIIMGIAKRFTTKQWDGVKAKLPLSMKWLTCYCADMLDVNWESVYQEVLTIEAMFAYILEPMDSVKTMITFRDCCDQHHNGYRLAW